MEDLRKACLKHGGGGTFVIYVLSDIHGHSRRFDSILTQIHLQPEDMLYILGDVIDRNPDGIRLLRRIMKMANAKMLLGNHELMMLKLLYDPVPKQVQDAAAYRMQAKERWYRNGGEVTHAHLKRIRKNLRQEVFSYLSGLPLSYEVAVNGKHYVLVHAAPTCLYPGQEQAYEDARTFAVWMRYDKDFPTLEGKTVIFGHSTTKRYQNCNPMQIWHSPGWIGIDCGSSFPEHGDPKTGIYGRLACLRLDDGAVFYSEEPQCPGELGNKT